MNHRKRIAFFGSDEIALPCLNAIEKSDLRVDVCAVLTQPDRRSGRGRKLHPNAIKVWAMESGLPVHDPEKPGKKDAKWIKECGIDLILVMAYGHILKHDLLTAAPLGCFNLHASMLPLYRGASPIETSIAMGDLGTGVTLMEVVPKMDSGAIIDVEKVTFSPTETGPSLRKKLAQACVPLVIRTMPFLLDGNYQRVEQNELGATYCRKLTKEDGRLNFTLTSKELESRMRAFAAWPGSFLCFEDTILKVGKLKAVTPPCPLCPGERFSRSSDTLVIGTSDGAIEILEIQKPGGKMLAVSDFLRGFDLPNNVKFPSPSAPSNLLRKISDFSQKKS